MPLYIKNMVCDRCILVVRQELDKLNLGYKNIKLGEVAAAITGLKAGGNAGTKAYPGAMVIGRARPTVIDGFPVTGNSRH